MLTVIIAAGGRGLRMGAGQNKLLLPLAGEPLLCRTVSRLQRWSPLAEIVVVAHPREVTLWQELLPTQRYPKVAAIVPGGATRTASIWAGLQAVSPGAEWIAIHDGARPLVPVTDLEQLWELRSPGKGIILGTAVHEAIKEVALTRVTSGSLPSSEQLLASPFGATKGGEHPDWPPFSGESSSEVFTQPAQGQTVAMVAPVPRSTLWHSQTPQLFEAKVIQAAYREVALPAISAGQDLFTDDAEVAFAWGCPIEILPGWRYNIKITQPEDLPISEIIWREQERQG
ncbi:MAG: 2-C-methyl-D-erythritol 4-phosphate cytidylyltransferase [Symbiobacteriaceae bacterium]|nr:2-C-methyl-D-erythritol 4-phosphate cytidylyltransferase [Symbiobacteriaceae bacterium]